jgi:hypothetical protein
MRTDSAKLTKIYMNSQFIMFDHYSMQNVWKLSEITLFGDGSVRLENLPWGPGYNCQWEAVSLKAEFWNPLNKILPCRSFFYLLICQFFDEKIELIKQKICYNFV